LCQIFYVFRCVSEKDFNNIPGVVYRGLEKHNGGDVAEFILVSGGYHFEVVSGKLIAGLLNGYEN
jgi:hypothetical protein